MSERITHTAVVDDCFRLASADPSLHDSCRRAMAQHHELARLASATRQGDRFNVILLERIRQRLSAKPVDSDAVRRLAFVLGWVCHRAADRQMKPVFRETCPEKRFRPTQCSVYHDAHILKVVYGLGSDPLYPPAALGLAEPSDPQQWQTMRALFHALLQQSLIEMHTLVPDPDEPEGWVDRVCDRTQQFYVDVERYAKAITSPHPDMVKKYVADTGFYAEQDRLVSLARAIQHESHHGDIDLREERAQPAQSHYGKALELGTGYIVATSDFLSGEIGSEQLSTAFHIGVKGRDGKSV